MKIVASSVDPLDKAQEVADEVNFPIGYGLTKDTADLLGSYWEERRQIIQPSEVVIDAESNKIIAASYSDGPLGRTYVRAAPQEVFGDSDGQLGWR